MDVRTTELDGVLLIAPAVFHDPRGHFLETWHAARYAEAGLPEFVQDNVSRSRAGVLRGLHFQHPHPQGKLISVMEGEIFDVAVDIRRGSPTFGRWTGHPLSAVNAHQLFVPEGYAHGFVVTSAHAVVSYKCTDLYHPEAEGTILWNDPELGITWPMSVPVVSDRDGAGRLLRDFEADGLPGYPRDSQLFTSVPRP